MPFIRQLVKYNSRTGDLGVPSVPMPTLGAEVGLAVNSLTQKLGRPWRQGILIMRGKAFANCPFRNFFVTIRYLKKMPVDFQNYF